MNLTPSKQESEKINTISNEIISKINIKDATAILGGSGAKNTWLPGTHDIDIYVKFNYDKYKNKDKKLSDILHAALKSKFKKLTRLHGSRDYFQLKHSSYNIEIIPILDIATYAEAKNITDISPLHITWVNKNIKNLANDIRLAKQFCKANHLYGAESHLRSFSGYVLEILVINYGSFINLVNSASNWKPKQVIDFYNVHKDPFAALNISKLESPLIIIDPVQPDRNASAALSFDKFHKFIEICRQYSKHPSQEFLKHKQITRQSLQTKFRSKLIIMLQAALKKGKRDIVGAKALKAFEHIGSQLSRNDFIFINADIIFNNKAIMYYILDKKPLPAIKKHYGPPINNEKHLLAFKKKWHNYKIIQEGNRVYINVKRKYTKPLPLVKSIIKSKDVKQLVAGIKLL